MAAFELRIHCSRRLAALVGLACALTFVCQISQLWAQTAPAPARADLSSARELVRAGKLEEADRALAELRLSFPDDASVFLLHGEVLLAQGKPQDALGSLRRAAELAPQKPRVFFSLGAALSATEDTAGALEAFAKELENNTDAKVKALAHLNRSILLQKSKQPAEAAGELEAAVQLDPSRQDAYGDLVELYLELGRTDDAAGALQRSEAAGIRSARSSYRVGAAYFKQKAVDKAVPLFTGAIELQPDLAEAELALASSLDQLGRKSDADAHFLRYLELRPDAPEAAEIRKRLKTSKPR